MEEVYSLVSLDDNFMIGSASSGAIFAQNMYGLYVRFAQSLPTDQSNLEVAATAYEWVWKPLLGTSLGHTPIQDGITPEVVSDVPTSNLFLMKRDYRDGLVQSWKTFAPELSWEEFRDGPMGFSMVQAFEDQISEITFECEFSYEEMVKEPQVFLTRLVDYMLPRQDNPELPTYGQAKREISFDIIDLAVQESQVRELREGASPKGLLDAVGVYRHFLNRGQIEEIEEFLMSL